MPTQFRLPMRLAATVLACAAAFAGAPAHASYFAVVPVSGDASLGPSDISQFDGYRAWKDGTFAQSCEGYVSPSDGHTYTGATGNGVYRISPAGVPLDVYCDQTADGGWTLLVKQAAGD